MPGNEYPPGETPPPLLMSGPGYERLNELFGYNISMSFIPEGPGFIWTPGTSTSPGRLRLSAVGGGGTAPATPPLTIVNASAKDKTGATHPGRFRVYNGFLGGLLPGEMRFPDAILPDNTDNHCYLTAQNGTNYVYGKVLVDAGTGLYTRANIYTVTTSEEADGTYAYLLIGYVNFDGTALSIFQITTGNKSLVVLYSSDGTMINPIWS